MMAHASDEERWIAIVAAEGRGTPIGPEDAAFRRRYEEAHPELAGEAALWADLGRLGARRGGALGPVDDDALAARILAQAAGEAGAQRVPAAEERPRRRAIVRRGVAGTFAGVALAATFLAALAAELMNDRDVAPPPPRAPDAAPAQASAWLEPPPRSLDVQPAATAPAPQAPPDAGVVEAAGAAVAPRAAREGHRGEAHAGPSADELLRDAQLALAAGRDADASAAYLALLARHPGSPEARVALVSLGRLSLSGGDPATALGYFERYLAAGRGGLGAEARYGRIEALRQLGRGSDERAAIDDFLSRHGDSVYAARLRARAEGATEH
ncbi:tetratricopeptide repeat protein [Sorangium sp. So ce128]|uniref:tetratricopeptide repeat protein n=1 Tax=Sorangium sp. So ce128 TaxID=3133281 RepID=UPI003F636FB5